MFLSIQNMIKKRKKRNYLYYCSNFIVAVNVGSPAKSSISDTTRDNPRAHSGVRPAVVTAAAMECVLNLTGYISAPAICASCISNSALFMSLEIEQADSPKALALHRECNKWDFSGL